MSSLLAALRKKGLLVASNYRPPDWLLASLRDAALHHDTPKVNIQSVADQCRGQQIDFHDDLQDITPPFSSMWLEWATTKGRRIAFIAQRMEAPARHVLHSICRHGTHFDQTNPEYKHYVEFWLLQEESAAACLMGRMQGLTDQYGRLAWARTELFGFSPASDDAVANQCANAIQSITGVALEALVRMNTDGTRVMPPWLEFRHIPAKPNPIRPACVWHTIHIGGDHHVHGGKAISREAEERREHWVRACRKDYRIGPGLFGRLHKLVWVPEHKRGNPELGCVIPEYVVHAKENAA